MAGATVFTGRTAWARNLATPVRDFLSAETGGALALLVAIVAALAWANSPWSDSYESVWTTHLSIRLSDSGINMELREWINSGLMTFFFLVIGLEAKREIDVGALRERRRIALPALSALGGVIVPIGIYLAFNAGGAGAHGWGAAMSTDTALALGILALAAPGGTRRAGGAADLLGRRRPARAARDRAGLLRLAVDHAAGHRAGCSPACSRCASPRRPGACRPRPCSAWACGSRCTPRVSTRS